MMHIPIHDHYTFETISLSRVVSGDDGVVENTEPHGAVAHGMVSGRAQERVGVANLDIHYGLRPIHRSACRIDGSFKRTGTERRIAFNLSPRALRWPTIHMRTHSF